MMYYIPNKSVPAPLPFRIRMSDGRIRTNPATFTEAEIEDAGYVAAPEKPDYDPATQRVIWAGSSWDVEPLPPEPEPQPLDISKLEFVDLVQQVGGMSDADLVKAYDDPDLRPLWIKLDMASAVVKSHTGTTQGLLAMASKGYLTNSPQDVLDAWPTK